MSDAVVPHKAEPSAPPARFAPGRWFARAVESDLFYSFRRSRLTMVAAAVTVLLFLAAIFLCQIVFGAYGMVSERRLMARKSGAVHA